MTPAEMALLHARAFPEGRAWSAASLAATLAGPGVFAASVPQGFALARVVADEAELLTIATDPGHRRRGVARALMADWQAEAARRGAVRAFLEVGAGNAAARALYAVCGYEVAGLRRGYYPGGEDALIMQRALT